MDINNQNCSCTTNTEQECICVNKGIKQSEIFTEIEMQQREIQKLQADNKKLREYALEMYDILNCIKFVKPTDKCKDFMNSIKGE